MVEVRNVYFSGNRISLDNFLDSLDDIRTLVQKLCTPRGHSPDSSFIQKMADERRRASALVAQEQEEEAAPMKHLEA